MFFFKTGLILNSKTKKSLSLPETFQIHIFQFKFAVDQKFEFIYVNESGIAVYTTNPINFIKKIDYKKEIKSIAVGSEHLYILSDDSLTLYSKTGFNILTKDFKNCTLKNIYNNFIGIQKKSELEIYDNSFTRIDIIKGQCSYSNVDVLLVGDMNVVKVYIRNKKVFEISMPSFVIELVTDPLFSKIYCAAEDNIIYVFDLNGLPLKTMKYHTKTVRKMRLSFCGKFLYSSDDERICVWSTEDLVIKGYCDIEEGIEDFELFLVDDFEYERSNILI